MARPCKPLIRLAFSVITITALVATGCRDRQPPAPKQEASASELPKIEVKAGRKLLLTYAKPDGSFGTVSKLDDVPKTRRGWVRVVDLKLKPDRRRDHELVYVADLRKAGKKGAYPYIVMSRRAFETAAVSRAQLGATDPKGKAPPTSAKGASVIMYSTSWCGVCTQARAYLTQKGVAYVEKDIEKDAAASQELLQKAKAAGISASGVPVIDVNGTLMQGFDAARLDALLGSST